MNTTSQRPLSDADLAARLQREELDHFSAIATNETSFLTSYYQYYKELCAFDSVEESPVANNNLKTSSIEADNKDSTENWDEEDEEDIDDSSLIYDLRLSEDGRRQYQPVGGFKKSTDASQSNLLPRAIHSAIRETLKKQDRHLFREEVDRATTNGMDAKTRMLLLNMVNAGTIASVNGCIASGKEANVYHAVDPSGKDIAVKIFKTSTLEWKNRDMYISGDPRFRKGYNRKNSRKMVATWCEKETRNLIRMSRAGVPCPNPIALRQHVLVMSFIGKDGWPAPLLKDVQLTDDQARDCFRQCVILMRTIYHVAKLVHADFSEYNLLYLDGKVFVIDVGQSVNLDHPEAKKMLLADCQNVVAFFEKKHRIQIVKDTELADIVQHPTAGALELQLPSSNLFPLSSIPEGEHPTTTELSIKDAPEPDSTVPVSDSDTHEVEELQEDDEDVAHVPRLSKKAQKKAGRQARKAERLAGRQVTSSQAAQVECPS